MSGGISAIKGFDYQATVILDRLFFHFDKHNLSAKARPEGIDDLDLSWIEGDTEHRQYIQIKKPKENNNGELQSIPWTLSAAVDELFPSAITHLLGNNHRQLWILGDTFDDSVSSLINAREEAPNIVPQVYWDVVHKLARKETLAKISVEADVRSKLLHWKIPSHIPASPEKTISMLIVDFKNFAKTLGASENMCALYTSKVTELHACLPSILARIEILETYGPEEEVIQQVNNELKKRYSLSDEVIEKTLFRNLRGFINDISKQPGRSFNKEEFELELRCVWPQMIPIKDFPELDSKHIFRHDLAAQFTTGWIGRAIEAIGISGSGKTMLTAEIRKDSDRLTYYAEVRPNVSLRDILVGVAFHLRRQGFSEPFSTSVKNALTEEETLKRIARSYATIPCGILLLIDLVEGTCSTTFSRDLATFIRSLSSSSCRIAVFGQESALRELTFLEREEYNIKRLDIRGFKFEEFVKLVMNYHAAPDQAVLWDIYQKITVGQSSGLLASLAHTLARTSSLQDMIKIAAQPAENILAYAERMRFARISKCARSAAEKLVCFTLPFLRKDAEEIFPEENIGEAINELLIQGLLRYHDKDSYEMHETVRAGLEGMLAIGTRRSTHQALAAWYNSQGLVTAEIFHLDRANKPREAQNRARKTFLCGEQWSELSVYVIRHKLVHVKDVIAVIAKPQKVEHSFLLADILRGLEEDVQVSELFDIFREQLHRYFSDYHWSSAIVETILEFAPEELHNLIVFSIDNATNEDQAKSALNWLEIGMMRKGCIVTSHTIEFFKVQPPHIKRMLIGILLRGQHREALQAAFQFLTSNQELAKELRKHSTYDLKLHINSLNHTIEFLAAIPRVEVSSMLISKSALLGVLSKLIWSQREKLRIYCIEVLKDDSSEEVVIENAIRVLIFLAEPSLFSLCEPFLNRKDRIRTFAISLPILQPAFFDFHRYEAQLFDCNAAMEDRFTALFMLALTNVDLGSIYSRLKLIETDSKQRQAWDFMFLMQSIHHPFREAIDLLEAHISSLDNKDSPIIIPTLMKLGELPDSDATNMLTRALTHSSAEIRMAAALSLAGRRSSAALPALISQYRNEDQESVAVQLAVAIVASGAKSALDLQGQHNNSLAIQLWQSILIMRSRDANMADWLVNIAIDPFQNWQLRRTAIFAAGRLPYNIALDRIFPVIMSERSPLTIDHSENLGCHALLSSFLTDGYQEWPYIFVKGRASFIDFFAGIFEEIWSDWIIRHALPSSVDAAGWFYDRLVFHGWPEVREAPDRILNELHVPLLQSAALRSLRFCGQVQLIEQQLATADHIWFAMKCLTERRRAGKIDPELVVRLRSLVESSPFQGNALLHRVIDEFDNSRTIVQENNSSIVPSDNIPISVTYITYDDAVQALSNNVANFKATSPLVLINITHEQCERLIQLADPVNDPEQGTTTYTPIVKFTPNSHVVAQQTWTSKGSGESLNSLVRPAIVVANSFGLPIPWLNKLMTESWRENFVHKYLECLGAVNDSSLFYEALAKYEDIMILSLCNINHCDPVRKYIDVRIIPTLLRYISSGTDEVFEGLCTLALQVDTLEIDPVLSGLLHRWSQCFDKTSIISQNDDRLQLWRGFKRLTEHPRFAKIRNWMSTLVHLLQTPIRWFDAENIVRVLERDPRSYILIESRLFKTKNWVHFYLEEIDQLDDAAERLFRELLEK